LRWHGSSTANAGPLCSINEAVVVREREEENIFYLLVSRIGSHVSIYCLSYALLRILWKEGLEKMNLVFKFAPGSDGAKGMAPLSSLRTLSKFAMPMLNVVMIHENSRGVEIMAKMLQRFSGAETLMFATQEEFDQWRADGNVVNDGREPGSRSEICTLLCESMVSIGLDPTEDLMEMCVD